MKNLNRTKQILVIEDSLDNQYLLKVLIEARGHKVHCASNGREALLLLSGMDDLPHLIFLDANMPIMNGYEFRLEQSRIERLKSIPVIVMTGDTDFSVAEDMLNPQRILIKPLDLKSLVQSVSDLL